MPVRSPPMRNVTVETCPKREGVIRLCIYGPYGAFRDTRDLSIPQARKLRDGLNRVLSDLDSETTVLSFPSNPRGTI